MACRKQGAINGLYKDKAMPSFRAAIKVQHYVKTCTVRESSQSFVPQIFLYLFYLTNDSPVTYWSQKCFKNYPDFFRNNSLIFHCTLGGYWNGESPKLNNSSAFCISYKKQWKNIRIITEVKTHFYRWIHWSIEWLYFLFFLAVWSTFFLQLTCLEYCKFW